MARALFGTPIFNQGPLYTSTLSGGSWEALLPLTNLHDRTSGLFARSTNDAITSTTFDEDFGVIRRVGALGLYDHNLSAAATLRMRLFSALPAFDSLTVGDAAWTSVIGTPTRSAAAFTCSDGVPLDLIGDDDGTATAGEAFERAIAFTGDGVKALRLRFKPGTNLTDARVFVYDLSAPATRLSLQMYSTAGVPAVAIVGGSGTLVSSTARGDGSYQVLVLTNSVIAANSNVVRILAEGTVSSTGNIYIGDIVAWNAATDQLAWDSGLVDVWPVVYPTGSVPADDPRMVTGKYSTEEMAALGSIGWTRCPDPAVLARYRRVQIVDTANPDNYVQIARAPVAGAWQYEVNFDNGAKSNLTTESTRDFAEGGAGIYDQRPRRREKAFQFSNLSEDAGLIGFDLQRMLGTTEQFLWVENPADTYHMPRRAYPAVLRELGPLEDPFFTYKSTSYAVMEDL